MNKMNKYELETVFELLKKEEIDFTAIEDRMDRIINRPVHYFYQNRFSLLILLGIISIAGINTYQTSVQNYNISALEKLEQERAKMLGDSEYMYNLFVSSYSSK